MFFQRNFIRADNCISMNRNVFFQREGLFNRFHLFDSMYVLSSFELTKDKK